MWSGVMLLPRILPHVVVIPHKWLLGIRKAYPRMSYYGSSTRNNIRLSIISSKYVGPHGGHGNPSKRLRTIFFIKPVAIFPGNTALKMGDVVFITRQLSFSNSSLQSEPAEFNFLHSMASNLVEYPFTSLIAPSLHIGDSLLVKMHSDLIDLCGAVKEFACVSSVPLFRACNYGPTTLSAVLGIVSSTVGVIPVIGSNGARSMGLGYSPFSLDIDGLVHAISRACGFAALIIGDFSENISKFLSNRINREFPQN